MLSVGLLGRMPAGPAAGTAHVAAHSTAAAAAAVVVAASPQHTAEADSHPTVASYTL